MEGKERKETEHISSMATCNETLSEEITDVNKVLDTLNPEQRTIIVKAFMAMETERTFRGPLPAPEDFRAYGEVIPNAPERILSMTEQQVSHRIHTEEKIVKSGLAESRIGQWMGYSIVLILIGLSTLLASNGHDWVAGAMMTAAIGLSVIFVLRQKPSEKETEGA
ncbi:DUF2335 domain-containing protein [Prevotella denticola]|uniref:DUF2335 domain-containing protein n=1 Tax=Prevotella denticola TaxID=28129 RepID=UPI001BAC64B3|nr:DUF2335 domain-containing protein [Prevotella denticola]QUB91163.1 DUF2335 domain-containing protein [Prevotella denticola]